MKIGFIGLGNMATAMIGGMLQKGIAKPEDIIGSSKTEATAEKVKSKFNIKILVSQKETSIYDDLLDNIKIEEILKEKVENPFVRMFKTIIKFKKTIKNKTIDVIHINIYNGVGMIYAYLAHKLGIKNIIVHAHNNGIDNDKFKIKLILHKICKTLFSDIFTSLLHNVTLLFLFPNKSIS